MNKLGISTDPGLLSIDLPSSTLMESPSVSTFLPEEDASTCPLISTTPSPPLAFSHPLTPCADNDSNHSGNCEDTKAETSSSSGSSSGIGMDGPDNAATTLFNNHAYQHLKKNGGENGISHQHGETCGLTSSNGHLHLNIKITKDTPSFVAWNWPLIRKCTFYAFMASLLGMIAIVVAMLVNLPKICNPKTAWYRGSVFYEIFPASFQDSNNDGLGDLRGIAARLDYLENLGISTLRLNSIFPSVHYPDDFENVTTLREIDPVIGTVRDLSQLALSLHARNMSLVLDLPLYPFMKHLEESSVIFNDSMQENSTLPSLFSAENSDNPVTDAMRKWLALGVDGFYIKGLEHFANDPNLANNIAEWKWTLGGDRVLIVSGKLIDALSDEDARAITDHIDLVEMHLDVSNGTQHIENQIKTALSGMLTPSEYGPWIYWSIGGVSKNRLSRGITPNATLAATIMQLMLPGTPNIFYGDEIALEESHDPHNEHSETKHLHHLSTMQWESGLQFTNRETLPWLPKGASASFENYETISKMIHLRDRSPSIYKNIIAKDTQNLQNTQIKHSQDDILVVERIYPRRNTFVSISNFGTRKVSMDMTSLYYSGEVMLGKTRKAKIYFREFEIGPMETIVVKLDK